MKLCKIHKFLLTSWVAVLFGLLLGYGGSAAANGNQPNFTQRILPLNCIFEVVNDGTGTLYYLTPAACGVVIPSPPSPQNIPIVTQPVSPGATRPVFFVPNTNSSTTSTSGVKRFPWEPIANVKSISDKQSQQASGPNPVALVGAAGVVLLVVVGIVVLF